MRALVFLFVVFVLTQGFSQTFSPAKLSPFTGSSDSAAGDFNHDGLLDLVTVNSSTNQVALWLSNGDGTFRPGGVQTVPGASGLGRLVIGDFNHDGNLDVAVLDTAATNGGAAIYLLLGDGAGLLGLPTGNYSVPATPNSIAVGDFNNDGVTDLAVLSQPADFSSATITLFINNGNGTFASSSITGLPQPFTNQDPSLRQNDALDELVAGDFDGDGRMDLLFRDNCIGCFISEENLFLLRNVPSTSGTTPGVTFAPPQLHDGYTGSRRLRVFDVDGDGRADIVAAYAGCHTPCIGIGVIYSNADGTTSHGGIGVGNFDSTVPLDVVVGDFNNDGILDLAAPVTAGVSDDFSHQIPNGIGIWTGKGGRTSLPSAPVAGFNDPIFFPLADNANPSVIGAGFIDGDNNKDIFTLNGDGTIATFLNTTSNAGNPCPYPDQPGVNFCLPADGSTTVHPPRLIASVRGETQPVNRIEIWVDGHKQTQVFNDKLNTTLSLSQAPHTVEIVAVDATGAFLKARRSFTVGGGTANGCSSPASPGVHVCSPQPGGPYNSPVRFVATGTGASGSVQTMELRVDGQTLRTEQGDQLDALLNLTPGFHEAIIVETDSAGASIKSSPVDFGINDPQSGCPTPATFPSVHFCDPVDGGTYGNSVPITASANVPNLTLLRLYINDQLEFETTLSSLSRNLSGPPEQLRLVVVAYDSSGHSYVDRRTVTMTGQAQGQCVAFLFPSVHICTPSNGSTTPSPVHILAGAAISSLQLFRLYVDNTPVFETHSSFMDTTVNLAAGPHHIVVVGYNSNGAASTDSVNTIVSGTVQTCAVPGTDRTINVCSPASGSTAASPVTITAQARWDHLPIVHMRVYVDNQAAFDVNNPQDGYLNTQLALASGDHNIVIVAWNHQGDAITSPGSIVHVP